jgi:putative AdoMet-dependent methyltransferase
LKAYKILKAGHKVAEFDINCGDNARFWEDRWQLLNIENGLSRSQSGYLGGKKFILNQLDNKDHILDAGCGRGQIVSALNAKGFQVTGIDFALDTVDIVTNLRPDLKIIYGNVLELPFEDKHFDVYLSFGIIEHFQNEEDHSRIFSEMKRVTKKKVLVTVPYLSEALNKSILAGKLSLRTNKKKFYQYYYSEEEFIKILKSYGLIPYKREFYSTKTGLKRYHKGFHSFDQFKLFRYLTNSFQNQLNCFFGQKYAHMIGYWCRIPMKDDTING